jgi:hypothetical protein
LITFGLLIRGRPFTANLIPLIGDLLSTREYIHFLNLVIQFLSSLLLLESLLLMLVHLLSLASCCCRRLCNDVVTTVGSCLQLMMSPKFLVSIQLLTSLLFMFPPLLHESLLLLGQVQLLLVNSVAGVPAVEGTLAAAGVSVVADVSAAASVPDV